MNENAKKWVAALRSGEFKQCTGALRKGDTYCCLGVACVLAMRSGLSVVETHSFDMWHYNGQCGVLPDEVKEWLGMADAESTYCGQRRTLTEDNDSGKTFAEIADIIESEPPGLFANPATP